MSTVELLTFGSETGGVVRLLADAATGMATGIQTPAGTTGLSGTGGAGTLAGLTDMSTYDLGTNNPSVAAIKSTANAAVPATQKGAASGVASLDSGGKVPVAQLPASVQGAMIYQGVWNASTNSPALASGTGTNGYFYKVGTAGTTALDGISKWYVGDHVAFNGSVWEKWDGVSSEVLSVGGQVPGAGGDVSLALANLSDGAAQQAAINSKVTNLGIFATTAALQTAYPAANNTGNVASVGSSAPYTEYTSNGSAWSTPTASGATIASGTLATGSIGSSMDNTTQTAAAGATLTLTAGMSTPTGFVVDAPSGCTISWGSTFAINGSAAAAGSLTVPSGGFAVFRQKQGTDAYWIAQGPNTDALTERTEGSTVTLVSADQGGLSLTPSACAVTVPTLTAGWWRAFKGAGAVTFSGTGITDERVSGATNPFCMLLATSGTTFSVVGNKA